MDAVWLGLEQEFYVFGGTGQIDFREMVHGLGIDGRRIDPGDANAYRCAEGYSITADGTEAEFATPPVRIGPGFLAALNGWNGRARTHLDERLPPGVVLRGASTHLSISVPGRSPEQLARGYIRTYAPALMLLWGPADAHGIFVRPRPGRLEFCGEYIDGPRLWLVAAFVAGSTQALADRRNPDVVQVRPRAALERYGFELRRTSFGPDLYTLGREAQLTRFDGVAIGADDQLREAISLAVSHLGGFLDEGVLDALKDTAEGRVPLGVEGPLRVEFTLEAEQQERGWPVTPPVLRRNGFTAIPAVDTWAFAVFGVEGHGQRIFAAVPREGMESFCRNFETGRLDEVVGKALDRPDLLPPINGVPEGSSPVLGGMLPAMRDLVAAEPEPWTLAAELGSARQPRPRQGSGTSASYPRAVAEARPGKFGAIPAPVAAVIAPGGAVVEAGGTGRGIPAWLLATGAGIVAVLVVIVLLLLLSGGGDDDAASPAGPAGPTEPEPTENDSQPTTASGATAEPAPTQATAQTPTPTVSPAATPADGGGGQPTAGIQAPQPTAIQPTARPTTQPTVTPQPTTAVQPSPTATPTPTPVPNAVPRVTSLYSVLEAPITTYGIAAEDPEGDPLTYSWRIDGEPCGVPLAPGPLAGNGPVATWSHSNDQGCNHAAPDHPVVVTVTVLEAGVARWRCAITGSNSQSIANPSCTPLNQ